MAIKLNNGDISAMYLGSQAVSAAYLGASEVWSAGGGAFDPSSISGLSVWYDFSDTSTVTESSGVVSAVADKSSSGADLSVTVGAPLLESSAVNGLSALRFDGSDDSMDAALPQGNDPRLQTLFAVFKRDSSSARSECVFKMSANPVGSATVDHETVIFPRFPGDIMYAGLYFNDVRVSSNSSAVISNQTALITIYGPDKDTVNVNGAQFATGTGWYASSSKSYSSGEALDKIFVGQSGTGFALQDRYLFDGLICEIILYNQTLGASDRQAVEAYLISKWGIS